MLSSLLGLSSLASNLGGKLFDWLQTRAQSTANTDAAAINAAAQQSHDEFAWPEMRFVIASLIALFTFHVGAVVFDSVFHTGHVTYALPHPMDEWEGYVILAPFAAAGAMGVVKRIFGK